MDGVCSSFSCDHGRGTLPVCAVQVTDQIISGEARSSNILHDFIQMAVLAGPCFVGLILHSATGETDEEKGEVSLDFQSNGTWVLLFLFLTGNVDECPHNVVFKKMFAGA